MSDPNSMADLLARFAQLDEQISAMPALALPTQQKPSTEGALPGDTTDWQAAFYALRRFPQLA